MKRSFRHWTPRYLWDRSLEKRYRSSSPDVPWLTKAANQMLETCLRPGDRGLEFGSGRSTIWFASRVGCLVSVEHQPEWHERVSGWLAERGLNNVVYPLHLRDSDDHPERSGYVHVCDQFEPASLEFVLVDGIYRDHCVQAALDKIIPGGMLIIDDVHRYLPSSSRAPFAVPADEEPVSDVWQAVYAVIKNWRFIWTDDGVSATAIYFKPCMSK